jgi:transposase
MPAQRLSMRRIRELLRLRFGTMASDRAIARALGVARSTVQDYLARAAVAGLTWPLPDELSDEAVEERLFASAGTKPGFRRRIEPDWAALVREMKRPGVNLTVLWEEYRQAQPGGYGYSRFCELYRDFEHRLSPTMRQHHVAGDKVFVDYSGKKVAIIDPATGEVQSAEIFVAVLGASNYTYAEASWTQTLPDWIGAHARMFQHLMGVTRLVIPDNLKSAVNKASFYDPELNRTYAKMAAHYDVVILPARPYRPRDKAKVEAGVRLAQTYILGRLRHVTFFSLAECNAAIITALEQLNGRPMRHLGVSRRALYEAIERPALRPLPATPYEYAEWRFARVGLDYHVEVKGAARAAARTGRRPHRRTYHRDIPPRQAHCRSRPPLRRPAARHRPRAHAQRPSPLRRLDPRALPPPGARHRREHRRPDQRHPRQPAASRARLPHLHRCAAPLPRS